jgi:hypothetical protein
MLPYLDIVVVILALAMLPTAIIALAVSAASRS